MYWPGADRTLGNVTKGGPGQGGLGWLRSTSPKKRGTLKPALYFLYWGRCLLIHQITALIESNFALNGISSNVINIAVRYICWTSYSAARPKAPQGTLIRPDNRAFWCQWSSNPKLRNFGKWVWVVIRFLLRRCIRRHGWLTGASLRKTPRGECAVEGSDKDRRHTEIPDGHKSRLE